KTPLGLASSTRTFSTLPKELTVKATSTQPSILFFQAYSGMLGCRVARGRTSRKPALPFASASAIFFARLSSPGGVQVSLSLPSIKPSPKAEPLPLASAISLKEGSKDITGGPATFNVGVGVGELTISGAIMGSTVGVLWVSGRGSGSTS